jgi:hypothetical protein
LNAAQVKADLTNLADWYEVAAEVPAPNAPSAARARARRVLTP